MKTDDKNILKLIQIIEDEKANNSYGLAFRIQDALDLKYKTYEVDYFESDEGWSAPAKQVILLLNNGKTKNIGHKW